MESNTILWGFPTLFFLRTNPNAWQISFLFLITAQVQLPWSPSAVSVFFLLISHIALCYDTLIVSCCNVQSWVRNYNTLIFVQGREASDIHADTCVGRRANGGSV